MNRFLGLLVICLLLFSCNNSVEQNSEKKDIVNENISSIGRNNYAVVWHWTTTDKELVVDNALTFTKELLSLWEKKDIENVYFDLEAEVKNDMQFPSISFFVKAHGIKSARKILDELTIVKKEIASYKLFPVGMLWLGKNQDSILSTTNYKSFVTVWETNEEKPVDNTTKAQNDAVLELWNSGIIENVYFDIEGVSNSNEKTDFVFYVNADNIDKARTICETLPFSKENIASYKIFQAGVFWLGKHESNNP